MWGFSDYTCTKQNPIAPCEAAAVAIALWDLAGYLRSRRVIFFVDNTTALYSLVKGSSGCTTVARSVAISKFIMGAFAVQVWFEFVDSKSNWADGISRDLGEDELCAKLGVVPTQVQTPTWLWSANLEDVWWRVKDHAAHDLGPGETTIGTDGECSEKALGLNGATVGPKVGQRPM